MKADGLKRNHYSNYEYFNTLLLNLYFLFEIIKNSNLWLNKHFKDKHLMNRHHHSIVNERLMTQRRISSYCDKEGFYDMHPNILQKCRIPYKTCFAFWQNLFSVMPFYTNTRHLTGFELSVSKNCTSRIQIWHIDSLSMI